MIRNRARRDSTSEGHPGALLEKLEPRVLLSGTVTVMPGHGPLRLVGDSLANQIVVDQVGLPADQVRVTGLSGTQIQVRGKLSESVVVTDVDKGIAIGMGDGNDNVLLDGLSAAGNVMVDGGLGQNILTIRDGAVGQGLHLLNSQMLSLTGLTVGGSAIIETGGGSSIIALKNVEIRRNLHMDVPASMVILTLSQVAVQGVTGITTGPGGDIVSINDSTFGKSFSLVTGDGADLVQIEASGSPTGPATVFLGPVTISLGEASDMLLIGIGGQPGNHAEFSRSVTLDGGGGGNMLVNPSGVNVFEVPPVIVGF